MRGGAPRAPPLRSSDPSLEVVESLIVDDLPLSRRIVGKARLNVGDAIGRAGVVLEEARYRAAAALVHRQQLLEEVEHPVRVVAGAVHEIEAPVVPLLTVGRAEPRHLA